MSISTVHEALENDLLLFGKVCLPETFSLPSPKFHRELANDFINPNLRRLNILAPRDHAKSSLAGLVLVLHHLFFGEGRKFVILVSKTEGHAIRLLESVKNALEYSKNLHKLFGYHGKYTAQRWARTEVILDNGNMILVRGTGQMVRGMKHINQRPTLIILDDPEDENNTKTDEAMEINLRWFLQGLEPAADAITGRVVVIGTPLKSRCMVEVLAKMNGWFTRRYSALHDEGPRENWFSLWPERWSVEQLVQKKKDLAAIGRVSIFYMEYQCVITGDEAALIRPEDIRIWKGHYLRKDGRNFLKVTQRGDHTLTGEGEILPVNIFTGIDPASTVTQYSDFSTIVSVALDAQWRRYILPYYRRRVRPMQLADDIVTEYQKYHSDKTRIESNGYQEMLRDYLRQSHFIPGLEIKEISRTKKSRRIESLQPLFGKRSIYLPEGASELENELLTYPRSDHDDLLDGLYYACKANFIPYDYAPVKRERNKETYYSHFEDDYAEVPDSANYQTS